MREIKFRAWLKYEEKMIDVKAIDWDEEGKIFSVNYPEGKFYNGYDSDCIELMQYTGLKDKNGVEIYEGDIVNICGFSDIDVVEYDNLYVGYVLKSYAKNGEVLYVEPLSKYTSFNSPKLEVIGNIYENKELLNENN